VIGSAAAGCLLSAAGLAFSSKNCGLRFPSDASSIRETATPADHVPGKTRLCSYHSAAVRKSNPATSPTTALSAPSSFQTDLSTLSHTRRGLFSAHVVSAWRRNRMPAPAPRRQILNCQGFCTEFRRANGFCIGVVVHIRSQALCSWLGVLTRRGNGTPVVGQSERLFWSKKMCVGFGAARLQPA